MKLTAAQLDYLFEVIEEKYIDEFVRDDLREGDATGSPLLLLLRGILTALEHERENT